MAANKVLERNLAFYQNIQETNLIAVSKYKSYFIFMVEHGSQGLYRKIYTTTIYDNRYLTTNGLTVDVFYEKMVSVLG